MLLHIANDYAGSKVYSHLLDALFKLGVDQSVYSAIRDSSLLGKNQLENIPTYYSKILNPYCRFNYLYKEKRIFKDICYRVDFKNVKQVHAHTWFSDGGVALAIKREFGIPYTVSIRNTDINVFWRYLVHLRRIGIEILSNADKVIFISEAHKKRMLTLTADHNCAHDVINRAYVIPNGVDNFWLDSIERKKIEPHQPFRLLYVGKFDPGKNVLRLINAVQKLNGTGKPQYHLRMVGGTGRDESKIQRMVKRHPECLELRSWTNSKEELRNIYRSCDAFVMPSLRETFGLVYIEAMSQGLPVLYTLGEGIDGFFEENCAIGCNPKSIDDIASKISLLRSNYRSMEIDRDMLENKFCWSRIAQYYKDFIYNKKYTAMNTTI